MIWPGETKARGRAIPFICAEVPPRVVGQTSCEDALAEVPAGARLLPKTVAKLPGVTGAVKLAPFTTPPGETIGACAANDNGMERSKREAKLRILAAEFTP